MKIVVTFVLLSMMVCGCGKKEEKEELIDDEIVEDVSVDQQNSTEEYVFNEIDKMDHARFALGYIDEDDIPELFVCYGNAHVDRVYVYQIKDDALLYIGNFGETGRFSYYEKQNMILSSAGGMGVFHFIYYRLEDYQAIVDSWFFTKSTLLSDGTISDYYACDRDVNEPYTETYYFLDVDLDRYEVTKEEYEFEMDLLEQGLRNPVTVHYKDMKPLKEFLSVFE